MKKKIILLNISKSPAEIDWILPVLFELNSKYRIYTIFQSLNVYKALEKDEKLFNLWNEISDNYSIDNKFDKVFRYLSKKIFKNFNFKKYLKRKNIIFEEIKVILSEFGTYPWVFEETIKILNRPLTVHFPTSSFIFGIEQKNKKIPYRLNGDRLLLCNKLDIDFWKKRIEEKKIKIVGVPKYDKQWLQKLEKRKIDTKKKVILIAYSSRFNNKLLNFKKLEDQLNGILKAVNNFKDCKIIFKIHPRKNDPHYLQLIKKFKDLEYEVSSENIISLAGVCDVFLHDKDTSVIHDGLMMKKPCIEYWKLEKKTNVIEAPDYLKLNVIAENSEKLENLIKLALYDSENEIWKKQQRNFLSNIENFNQDNSKYAAEYLDKLSIT